MRDPRHEPAEAAGPLRPAAFLDRDGTLMVEREYLSDPERVELIRGTVEALSALRGAGYALVVVTNQSGIARGLYDAEAFLAVERRMEELLAAGDVVLDGVYYCPHHPDASGPCECRKPGLALYRQAAQDLSLDLARSLYVGDKLSDVRPAAALGGTPVLVRTGYGDSAPGEEALPRGTVVLESIGALAAWLKGGGEAG